MASSSFTDKIHYEHLMKLLETDVAKAASSSSGAGGSGTAGIMGGGGGGGGTPWWTTTTVPASPISWTSSPEPIDMKGALLILKEGDIFPSNLTNCVVVPASVPVKDKIRIIAAWLEKCGGV